MTKETHSEIRAHLSAKLMETATKMQRDQVLPESEIATAYTMVGVAIAACHFGPALAAEWLRDIADTIEQAEKALNGPVQ